MTELIPVQFRGEEHTFVSPLLATFLLTGGRAQEVLGLMVNDVDFDTEVVHFRRNQYRDLKRPRHDRRLILWPQLREFLEGHAKRRMEGLLFPATNGGMIRDVRGSLPAAARRAGIDRRLSPHTFRHTFAAARLQTLDNGAPTSPYTVMRELGHSSLTLIERTYGHLQNVRHRSPVLEYRIADVLPFRKTAT